MQMDFIKRLTGVFAGMFLAAIASAHPGHAPGDLTAAVSQPLAGPDPLAAFLALASVLLLTLRLVVKQRVRQKQKARK